MHTFEEAGTICTLLQYYTFILIIAPILQHTFLWREENKGTNKYWALIRSVLALANTFLMASSGHIAGDVWFCYQLTLAFLHDLNL